MRKEPRLIRIQKTFFYHTTATNAITIGQENPTVNTICKMKTGALYAMEIHPLENAGVITVLD